MKCSPLRVSFVPWILIPGKENAQLSNSNDNYQMTTGHSYVLISRGITFKSKRYKKFLEKELHKDENTLILEL